MRDQLLNNTSLINEKKCAVLEDAQNLFERQIGNLNKIRIWDIYF